MTAQTTSLDEAGAAVHALAKDNLMPFGTKMSAFLAAIRVGPVTVRRIDNQLLRFILERRHSEYRERVESGAVDMDNLNVGRQRVAEEKAKRDAATLALPPG